MGPRGFLFALQPTVGTNLSVVVVVVVVITTPTVVSQYASPRVSPNATLLPEVRGGGDRRKDFKFHFKCLAF